MNTTISIIIPVYNGELLIERCLDSVVSQNGGFDLEIIVINDGSTDNSEEIILKYDKPIKYLNQDNQGPAAARNKGIEVASGKYLAFLDADDYWLRGFLSHTVDFLERNPVAVAVSTGQMHKIIGKKDKISPAFLASKHSLYSKALLLNDYFSFWTEHNHVCTGSVLMRTDIVKQTCGQRTDLRITEDLEFWAYLATYGKWGFIPKILFVSDGSVVTKARGWIEKNMVRWSSAPALKNWEQRIITRFNEPVSKGYLAFRGRIATNLAYSMIQSSRDTLARQTIRENLEYLSKNKIVLLLKIASGYLVLWRVACYVLRYRELTRKIN